jgi:SAM-dependent methyltransferase
MRSRRVSQATSSLTVEELRASSYPDFVALIGQHNTPPGADRTVREWVDTARIDAHSYVLDLACSTGYSGRKVYGLTGASVHGIDLSTRAIETARAFAEVGAPLTYQVANAAALPIPDRVFSHALGGCNFGFIAERETALAEVARTLQSNGLLCVASFYFESPPPSGLLDRVAEAVGFRPNPRHDHSFWSSFFERGFELVSERRTIMRPAPDRTIERNVKRAIRGSRSLRACGETERYAAATRLLSIRRVVNEQRAYQGLSVAVWRLRA